MQLAMYVYIYSALYFILEAGYTLSGKSQHSAHTEYLKIVTVWVECLTV